MNKLFRYLRSYKKESILGPLFKLLEASFELIVPLVIAAMIDRGIGGSDRGYIVRMALLLIMLGLVGLICAISAQYFAARAATEFSAGLRSDLFRHIGTLSRTELDTLGSSSLITRMTSDINQIESGVNLVLRLFLRSPFIVFGAMIMAFTIDTRSALLFAAVIPVLSVIVFGIMLLSIPLYKKVQKLLDRVLCLVRENLQGVRVIRAFCREEEEKKSFSEANSALASMQRFVGRISSLMNPLTYVILNLAVIALLYVGAVRVDAGELTQGDVVALYNYMSQILVELIKLANLIITVTRAWACGDRVQAVFEQECSMVYPAVSSSRSENSAAVVFEKVSLTYKNAGAPTLSDISFSVMPGETLGVIGGTGSGKTSLINLIPRFYDASSGRVLVDGIPVGEYTREDLRKKIGVVPQKALLFSGSIADNLRFGNPDASDDDLLTAVRAAQADDVIRSKNAGLSEQVESGGHNFSGGQKQRLTIARALVKKPEILILDDSSSALDYATDAALRKSIRETQDNTTVIIVSQRASSVRFADKIVVLDDGCAVGIGTHEELYDTCPVYREICDSQYGHGEKEAI